MYRSNYVILDKIKTNFKFKPTMTCYYDKLLSLCNDGAKQKKMVTAYYLSTLKSMLSSLNLMRKYKN